MRENNGIYRGKRIDTGAWKEGYLLGLQDRLTGKDLFFIVDEVGEYHRVDPETVGEYTGFTDKNGVKIYEGDICHFFGGEYYSGYWEINLWCKIKIDQECLLYLEEVEYVEVTGNIHDNPELLEKDGDI